ncbi:UNVERIFIED_CONTAM: protein EMSY-LIKE 3 [Sesamum latifolium]|uniref:Protein EMSY-LIKE 3 n=1 Tax=Sesamum latifolium TaxID=2727402 RepID=A0AAW2VK74_9LAMI
MQTDIESEIHNLEQIAYGAVSTSFQKLNLMHLHGCMMVRYMYFTQEKEGLITELRKELRVSDDEHRELLSDVNADDLIRRIREWREAGGNRNVAPVFPSMLTISYQVQQFQHLTLSSAGKWVPTSGIGGRRPNAGQPAFTPSKPMQYQFTDHVSSGAPMDDPSESMRDPLIGRRVMIRWPADNNFYEAVINEYNPVDGRHSLVYDSNTPNATVEWVNIKEVPAEDIRWVGDEPVISRLGEAGAPNLGRGRASSMNQFANEIRPSRNGVTKDDYEEIEILHTDTLIKKEHEQTLIEVIQKLADACDSGILVFASDDERPSAPGHSTGTQHNVDYRGPSHEPEITGRASSYELARG